MATVGLPKPTVPQPSRYLLSRARPPSRLFVRQLVHLGSPLVLSPRLSPHALGRERPKTNAGSSVVSNPPTHCANVLPVIDEMLAPLPPAPAVSRAATPSVVHAHQRQAQFVDLPPLTASRSPVGGWSMKCTQSARSGAPLASPTTTMATPVADEWQTSPLHDSPLQSQQEYAGGAMRREQRLTPRRTRTRAREHDPCP